MSTSVLARPVRPAEVAPLTHDATDAELIERFVAERNHDAFAILVRRHGQMVFGVCRRVLRDPHDAEEAFQHTFLILVRKARSLRQPERLSNWLYGVANRVASKAKLAAARRANHERAVPPRSNDAPVTLGPDGAELRAVLDEEMMALPEKDRAALVLCYLQGLTNEEAARRLGCPIGSMSYRLSRGRERLKRRLARRGLVCLALWPVFEQVLTERASAGEVPGGLVESTLAKAKVESDAPAAAGWQRLPAKLALLLFLLLGLGYGTAALAGWAPIPNTVVGNSHTESSNQVNEPSARSCAAP